MTGEVKKLTFFIILATKWPTVGLVPKIKRIVSFVWILN